jgi:uncharacterized protein (TIGR03382 family)
MKNLLVAFALIAPASAFAQATECLTDADCADGEVCALTDCGPTCDPDDPTCEPVDCGSGGVCIAVEEPPPSCTADSDCADGDICITQTIASCTGCACADDGDNDPTNDPPCDCPAEPECTDETFSFCGPRYLGDCAVDADCGAGFTCTAAESCACAISSDDAAPADCVCETSDTLVCVLDRVECTDDADCADGLVCVDEAANAPCAIREDGSAECDAVDDGTRICAPEGYLGGAVEARADANDEDGDDEDDGDDGDDGDIVTIDCSQSSAAGALPFAAALVVLLRRRRR